jgi:hypothetical protein
MWECESMIPGMTKRPVASITRAPRGASIRAPRAAILPSWISRSPFSIVPCVTVRSVPPRIRIGVSPDAANGPDGIEREQSAAATARAPVVTRVIM